MTQEGTTDQPPCSTRANGRQRPAYLRSRRWWERRITGALARVGALLVLGGAVFAGLFQGGHLKPALEPASRSAAGVMGLRARDVRIAGLTLRPPAAVLELLGIAPGEPLVGFDAARARRLLENSDWVKRAEVFRQYPSGVLIRIEERRPIARWEVNGAAYLVDDEGTLISSLDTRRFTHLPLLRGKGANRAASLLVHQLGRHRRLATALRHAERVSERRWNLRMRNGMTVLLPEQDVMAALAALDVLVARHGLLERAVARLDMRDPRRLRVALPSPSG